MDANLHASLATHPFFRFLYQMAREESLRHVLEVGAADGSGSTHILVEALRHQPERVDLHCLESDPDCFAQLKVRFTEDWVHCYPYFSVYPLDYPDATALQAFTQQYATRWRQIPFNQSLAWLACEQTRYQAYTMQQQPINGIAHLKTKLGIRTFDLVVLDGGEFSGPADLEAVYGARILILDDINTYKNHTNYLKLKADPAYYLIQEDWHWRHGCAVFKRRPEHFKPGISALVHTLNAAEQLPNCLRSLQWVDEILVVDMYSQDQTPEIAANYGARVCRHVPVTCVDEARNFGLSQLRHAWTLVLDADEQIPEAWVPDLQAACQQPDVTAYWLPRNNHFFGFHIPFLFPDYQLRLFQSQTVSWSGRVHEHPELLSGLADYLEAHPERAIQHQAYTNVRQYIERQLNYAEILWQQNSGLLDATEQSLRLRQDYEEKMQLLLRRQARQPLGHLEWLVRHLDRLTDLSAVAVWLQNTGQLHAIDKSQGPRLSAYSYIYNGVAFDYPFIESLQSVLKVADEVVVCYGCASQDQTLAQLEQLAQTWPHLRLLPSELWSKPSIKGETIRMAAEEAMAACRGDWLWHIQADEVYKDSEAQKVRELIANFHHQEVHGFIFNVLHFYGDYQTVLGPDSSQIGWYQHCVRLTRAGYGQHQGDAWTQTLKSTAAEALRHSDITLFHYGHVREKEVLAAKNTYMYSLYQANGERPDHFVDPVKTCSYLKAFVDTHPESMALRIAQVGLKSLKLPTGKPRLLVVCRYPEVKKGYGITFSEIYQTGILQKYYDVHHLAWHYHGPEQVVNGVHFYPDDPKQDQHPWRLRDLLYRLKPDNLLLHADAHFFLAYYQELRAWQGPITGWFTVDYESTQNPGPLRQLLQRCQHLLGLADFGVAQLKKDAQASYGKVPLGVNSQVFYPVSADVKRQLRQRLGLPEERFIFLTVANNFWRKGIEYTVAAMAELRQYNRSLFERSLLYLHTEITPALQELIQAEKLTEHIRLTPGYDPFQQALPTARLAQLYQAADAFLLTSLGEGFGMPLLEAQATGLPIIVSDHSVTREVAGEAALYIRCPGRVCGKNAERVVWMRAPDPEHAAEQMAFLMKHSELQQALRQKAWQQAQDRSWKHTAILLAAELAKPLGKGKLEYYPPEPGLIKV